MKRILKLKFMIYKYIFLSAFILGSVVLLTDPGPVRHVFPVMPGTNWLPCTPLLSAIPDYVNASGGWSILQGNEWSWIAGGIRQPMTTDSWDLKFSDSYTRYSFYGSNPLFIQIKNVTKEDNATIYRCRITRDGRPKKVYFILDVLDPEEVPPSLTNFSPEQVAEEVNPASITLSCTADGKPTPTITWTKVYDNGSDSDALFTGEQFVLSNNRKNAGKYRCKADNGIGSAINQTIDVTVNFPPKLTDFSPDQVAEEVDPASITLSCTADGKPTPTITWTKVYDNGSDSGALFTGEQFVLSNNRKNAAKYRCKADNGIGSAINQTIDVTVYFPPKLTDFSPDQVAEEDDAASITLSCTADGKPTPTITWTKVYNNGSDSGALFTEEQFVLSNNRKNAGKYRCKADNGIGSAINQTIDVTVNFKPENVMLTVNHSNNVISLNCSAVGEPPVHAYQLFENDALVCNSGGPIFVWSKIASSGGVFVYRCEAYNTLGTTNTTKTVTVNGQSIGVTCLIWKIFVAIISVVALPTVISVIRICCRGCFTNISDAVNPQHEMNYDVSVGHGNPPNADVKNDEDVGHDVDGDHIPLSVQENNANTGILPFGSDALE